MYYALAICSKILPGTPSERVEKDRKAADVAVLTTEIFLANHATRQIWFDELRADHRASSYEELTPVTLTQSKRFSHLYPGTHSFALKGDAFVN